LAQESGPVRSLKPLVKPVLWLMVVILLVDFSLHVPFYYTQRRGEFVAYLISSKVIAAGGGAAHFYDNDLFRKEIADLGFEGNDIFYPNPPTTALLFLPLSKLDFRPARQVWVILSLAFLVLALALQFKDLKLSSPWSLIALSIVLISQPLRADLQHGQVYTLQLLLTTLTWIAFRQRKQVLAGVAFSCMILTKLFALPLYLLFLLRQHWKAIWVSILSLLVVVLISLTLLTPAAWLEFFYIPQRIMEDPTLPVTAFQTLGSLIRHLFTFDPIWNPQPIMNIPFVATILLWALQLLFILLTAYAIRVSSDMDLSFAAVIALSIFLSPFAQDYTYTVLLLPIVILTANLRETPSIRLILLAVIAILLFAANLPFKSPKLMSGFWALFAYPKLYAGIIIWSLLIWLAVGKHREPERIENVPESDQLTPGLTQ
jgi:hypothetical protein